MLFKNEPAEDSPYYERVVATHNMLRVMESVRMTEGDDSVFKLYWEFGARIHHDKEVDFAMEDALSAVGLDASHAEAFEDDKWDDEIRTRMDAGLELVGQDVGTPIIAWERSDGDYIGIFGPVITRVPETEDSLKLWDGMMLMGDVDGFWELKKSRFQPPEFGNRPVI